MSQDEITCDLLREAYLYAAENSDDTSTQNGAVLIDRRGSIIAFGTNHLPEGVRASPERLERPTKYAFMEHAERDVIFAAAKEGKSTDGATLYCPWYACSDCARAIIAAGIKKVVGHKAMFDQTPEHWKKSIADGDAMLDDAGIECVKYDGEIGGVTVLFNGELWKP